MDVAALIKVLNVVALAAIMLSIGLGVRIEQIVAALRKKRLVLSAVTVNFVLVPLVTSGLLRLLEAEALVAAGFLILAVCPGAPVGPPFTALAKGDVAFATGSMIILAGLSAVLAPAILTLVLPWFADEGHLRFDYLAIVKTLFVTQLLPLGIGLAIYAAWPKIAERSAKPLALIANLLLLALVGLILANHFEMLQAVRLRGWLGMLLLLGASLTMGWYGGGSDRAMRRAMAITTGVRNAAVGLVIASANFAGTAAVTAVVAYAFVSIFGTLAFVLGTDRLTPRQVTDAPSQRSL
jgi:bile acid:Na+ symporter, BASS family